MNDDDKDPQTSTSTGPIQNLDDLKARGQEKAQIRAEAEREADKPRPAERLGPLMEALAGKAREAIAREGDGPAEVKPTVHDHQFRPPNTKPQPVVMQPGWTWANPAPVRRGQPGPPVQAPQKPADREPTNADKLYAKIEKSVREHQQARPPLAKPDRSPEVDHER